jgi:hypothetical protein
MVDTPGHRSIDHPEAPSADPKGLSSLPPNLPAFEGLSLDELRHEWRRLYRSEPPKISRDLLIRGIGYRLQEIQQGGLGKSTRRKLKTLAKMFRTTGRVAPDFGLSLKPGARLAWAHSHSHRDGRRIRVCRHKLSVAHQGRPENHRCPLVGPALFWSRPYRRPAREQRR